MAASADFVVQITQSQRQLHAFILSLVWNPARRYEPDASVNAMAQSGGITPKAVSDRLRRIRQALLACIQKTLAEEAFA